MAWGIRLSMTAGLLMVSSVAIAEPAGTMDFVPIAIGNDATLTSSVVVVRGDHLWKISQNRLDDVLGRVARPEEVAAYWRLVIERNQDDLESGDADLIYPGEVISLPTIG